MRRILSFASGGETLVGTLDAAPGRVGVLIVSGGRETRIGAHRAMALLAARLAARGVPVFRFDRAGIGDSTGVDRGYADSRFDILNAGQVFRDALDGVEAVVGFGNCDAASALALFGRESGVDAVVLANPWVIEPRDDLPPAAAIRARYAQRLFDPASWVRLLRGGIDLGKAVRGLRKAGSRDRGDLATRVLAGVAAWGDDAQVVLARGDATAIAYRDAASPDARATIIPSDSHSFAGDGDAAVLEAVILDSVARLSARLD
jgi:exosortase A-associated hydrolase 1